jgi:transposase InsO family protein
MGIRDRPISPRSPWQNGYAERLIGSIRRDCLDHVVVFGERHLRHLLKSYQKYYNEARTHLSLQKDAPVPRAVQTVGRTLAMPVLGGLHHQYFRASVFDRDTHLRRILGEFAAYYNKSRTHRALSQDAPVHRAIERLGAITSRPVLGGLHHQYCRI